MIYPERPSEINTGSIQDRTAVNVSEVHTIEEGLYEQFEKIKEDPIKTISFFGVEYFQTAEGQILLQNILTETHTELLPTIDLNNIVQILDQIDFSKLSKERRDQIMAEVNNATEERLFNELKKHLINDDVNCSLDTIIIPTKYEIVLNPESVIQRLNNIRKLKVQLKEERKNYINNPKILSLYRAYIEKINILIVNCIYNVIKINDKEVRIGNDNNRYLPYIKSFNDMHRRERNLSRFDFYLNGAGVIQKGRYTPFGENLLSFIDTLKKEQTEGFETEDFETEFGENFLVSPEFVKALFEIMLEANKFEGWRVIISEKATTLSVNNSTRTITIPKSFKRNFYSIKPTSSVLAVVAHEMTHVFQGETRKKIGITLFTRTNPARNKISSEGAGVRQEKKMQNKLGLPSPSNYQYFDTMQRKIGGGNYIECVIAFYKSLLTQHPNINKEEGLKLAINRTKRIFRNLGDTKSTDGFISNSDQLDYLEQEITTLIDKYGAITPYAKYLIDSGVINLREIEEIEETFKTVNEINTPDTIKKLKNKFNL